MLCAAGSYLLFTTHGSSRIVRLLLGHYLPAGELTIDTIRGTLAQGVLLHGVAIHDLLPVGGRNILTAGLVRLPPLSELRDQQWVVSALDVRLRMIDRPDVLTINQVTGSRSGLVGEDLELQGGGVLPDGAWMKIQRLESGWPLRLERITTLGNGRLHMPASGMILFFTAGSGASFGLRLYAQTLDARELVTRLPFLRGFRLASGTFSGVRLAVSPPFSSPTLDGRWFIRQLRYKGLFIADAPGSGHLRLRIDRPLQMHGQITLEKGQVAFRATSLTLEPSTMRFTGDPKLPVFDARGVSRVVDTTIHAALQGTLKAPELQLHSVPPMAQDRLLVMLATGKSWKSADTMLQEGKLSPDVLRDLVDYFVFAGMGHQLANRLGINETSFSYDVKTRGVGVHTLLFNRLRARYQLEPAQGLGQGGADPSQPLTPTTHRMAAEYEITDTTSVELEGEKESVLGPAAPLDPAEPPSSSPNTLVDKLLFKLKRRF